MINFRNVLRDQMMANVSNWVGPTSSSQLVKLVDKRLHDVEKTQLPYVVVTVRSVTRDTPPEIGAPISTTQDWLVHLYYLDMDPDYDAGENRQTVVMSMLDKAIAINPFLGSGAPLSSTDTDGNTEYVILSRVTDILFDSTGVELDYSFASELYLTVTTDRR